MHTICDKCKGLGIATVAGALILNCPIDPDKEHCPYLPDHQHTHQEVYVPPNLNPLTLVNATSGTAIDHPGVAYTFPDPDREGNTIYIVDVTASGDTSI